MKKISILLFTFLFFSFTYAEGTLFLSQAPKLEEATSTTMKIYWDKVDSAIAYVVYYGKTTKDSEDKYETSTTDFIDQTGATLEDLEPGTKYFMAVKVMDENAEEGAYSPEVSFETRDAASAEKLAVKDAAALSSTEFRVTFNNSLNASAANDFKIVDVTGGQTLEVVGSEVKGTSVKISMKEDLKPNTKYEITVISIEDIDGRSIESGVDGIISFTTPPVLPTLGQLPEEVPEEELPETTESGAIQVIPDLNAGMDDPSDGMAGENINTQDSAVTTTTKLPSTGPEHVILVILSLIVGAIVFVYTKKQQAS